MELPSGWKDGIVATLSETMDIRSVIHDLVDAYDIKALEADTQTVYGRLSQSNCPVRIRTEADNFGNVSWYDFGLYASRVAALSPAQFVQFVKLEFSSYCGDIGSGGLVKEIDEPEWDLIGRLHLLYLTMSVVDKKKTRNQLGFVMTIRRRIRTSTNAGARLISRLL